MNAARRTTQTAFFALLLLAPQLELLRYDPEGHHLIVLGRPYGLGLAEALGSLSASEVAGTILLKAILPWLAVLALFPLLGFFLGRAFCGWLCPEGALFELYDHLSLRLLGRRDFFSPRRVGRARGPRWLLCAAGALLVLFALPVGVGLLLAGYFVPPQEVWAQVLQGTPSRGLLAALALLWLYMLVMGLLLRHRFCRWVCAPGLMQMLFGWLSPMSLRVQFQGLRHCTDCRRCEEVCFMEARPRGRREKDISCINCGLCVQACKRELGPRGALLRLGFGQPREDAMISKKPKEVF